MKVYTRQRGAFITVKLALFLSSLAMVTVLAWLRIDWGITHWAYHAHFSNFWPGVYFALAGEIHQKRRGRIIMHAGKSWLLISDVMILSQFIWTLLSIPPLMIFIVGILPGFCMSLMDSLLACCFAVNTSNMLLVVVSTSVLTLTDDRHEDVSSSCSCSPPRAAC